MIEGESMDEMCCIRLEEQLFRNYMELYSLIEQCYKDISMLDGYKELQTKRAEWDNIAPNISNHIVRLLQKDLALTIWKIYFDVNSNANTITKFRKAINNELRNSGNEHKRVNRENLDSSFTYKLSLMRKQFLAHTDMKRNDSRIEISDLKDILDTICKEFNNVCNVVNDERVIGISEINIGIQDMTCQIELLALYSQEINFDQTNSG